MKKLLSFVLVSVLLPVSCSAFADTVSWSTGSGFDITPDLFKSYFNMSWFSLRTEDLDYSGYDFIWDESTKSERGYKVYTAKNADPDINIKMYVKNNTVHMIYGDFCITSSDDAKATDSWFNAVSAVLVSSSFSLDPKLRLAIAFVPNAVSTSTKKMASHFKEISEDLSVSRYRSGVVLQNKSSDTTSYVLDIKLSDTNASSPEMHIKMYMVSASGKLTVE